VYVRAHDATPPVHFPPSLHDALPIWRLSYAHRNIQPVTVRVATRLTPEERTALVHALEARTGKTVEIQEEIDPGLIGGAVLRIRSEEHTSELQSRENLVCRLLLEKKK